VNVVTQRIESFQPKKLHDDSSYMKPQPTYRLEASQNFVTKDAVFYSQRHASHGYYLRVPLLNHLLNVVISCGDANDTIGIIDVTGTTIARGSPSVSVVTHCKSRRLGLTIVDSSNKVDRGSA
jgi:hypothetical protein